MPGPTSAARVGRIFGLAVLGCLGLVVASMASTPADPAAAHSLWQWAEREGEGDVRHPAYIDAARAANRLRPWHDGYDEARERVRQVDEGRR